MGMINRFDKPMIIRSVKLPEEVWNKLITISKDEDRTIYSVIRLALNYYLKEKYGWKKKGLKDV
jgi:hypothetical protein